ncbi:MAG: Ig-like domain-containing protein, partial [Actinomycetota bacterium]
SNTGLTYVNSSIRATFNKQIDAGTINSSSFRLTRNSDGAPVSAQVVYTGSSMTASLRSNTALQSGAAYTATLTTAITDILGSPMSSQYQWSFTARDYVPPYFSWYDYGSTSTGLMLYEYAAGYVPYPIWYSGAGNWDGSRTKTTMADKINDDMPELYSFYNYGGSSAGLFVFDPIYFPDYEPQQKWASCAGCWDFSGTKVVTAADQLGKNVTEVITMYNY